MKKIAWSACILACTLTFAGCAVPKKPLIERPAPSAVTKQPPVASPTAPDLPTEVPQAEPLIIEGPLPGEIVEKNIEEELPSLQYIDARIAEYGRKLERWKAIEVKGAGQPGKEPDPAEMVSCFRKLQNVMQGYDEMRGRVIQAGQMPSTGRPDGLSIVEIQKSDIEFMESPCARLLTDPGDQGVADSSQKEEGDDLAQLETLIDRYSASREYQEVAKVWQKIPPAQLGRVNLRTKIHYGNALIHLNQQAKAAEMYQQVVDQMSASDDQATDLVSLRKVLADLYMASGNTKAAAIQYHKISEDYQNLGRIEEWSKLQLSALDRPAEAGPEMREYSTLLRNYLGFVPEEDGYKVLWQAEKFLEQYPYSPVSSNVEAIKENVKTAADKWFDGFMAGVDKLSGEKKFKEAQEKLETIPANILGPDKQLVVKSKNDELLLGEAVDQETDRMAQIQDLQNQWNRGMLLAGEEKFEEAIAVFAGLLDSEYSAKAQEKIKELSLAAAQADRKKAANLFVRFTKTTDLESRKKLLLESRKVLKDILVKYPNVEIGPKVISNIERVEQEMVAIDPAMLVLADQEDSQTTGADGADRVFAPPVANAAEQQPEELVPRVNQ